MKFWAKNGIFGLTIIYTINLACFFKIVTDQSQRVHFEPREPSKEFALNLRQILFRQIRFRKNRSCGRIARILFFSIPSKTSDMSVGAPKKGEFVCFGERRGL